MKKQLKKSLSLFLAVLMLMTCWVWVAPQKAEAGAPGSYDVTVEYNVYNGSWGDDNPDEMKVEAWYIPGNGTGTESTTTVSKVWNSGFPGEGNSSSLTLNVPGGWPSRVYIECRNDGVAAFAVDVTGIKINGTYVWQGSSHFEKSTTTGDLGMNWYPDTRTDKNSDGSGGAIDTNRTNGTWSWKRPVLDAATATFTGAAHTLDKVNTGNSSTSSISLGGFVDTYGVNWTGTLNTTFALRTDGNVTINSGHAEMTGSGTSRTITIKPWFQTLFPAGQKAKLYVDWSVNNGAKSGTETIEIDFPEYTATFYANGAGAEIGEDVGSKDEDGIIVHTDEKMTYGAKIGAAPGYAYREGFEFMGYYSRDNADALGKDTAFIGTKFDDKLTTVPHTLGAAYGYDNIASDFENSKFIGDTKWYAAWQAAPLDVTFVTADNQFIATLTGRHNNQMTAQNMYDGLNGLNAAIKAAYTGTTIKFDSNNAPIYKDGATSYVFDGWKIIKEDGQSVLKGDENSTLTKSVTFQAMYKSPTSEKFTVTFKDKDGTVLSTKNDYSYRDDVVGVPANVSEMAQDDVYSYEFIGWANDIGTNYYTVDEYNMDKEGAVIPYVHKDAAEFTVKDNATYVPVYKMTKREYSVSYEYRVDGGATETVTIDGYNWDENPVMPEIKDNYTNSGKRYFITGWRINGAGAIRQLDEIQVSGNMRLVAVYGRSEDAEYVINFYGKDVDGETDVHLNADSNIYVHGKDVVAPAVPEKIDTDEALYTFKKWTPNVTLMANGDKEYYAEYERHEYADVYFYNYDGSLIYKVDAKETQLFVGDKIPAYSNMVDGVNVLPEKPEDEIGTYTFTEWQDANGEAVDFRKGKLQGDLHLYAQFKTTYKEYEVKFVDDDGTDILTKKYHYGEEIEIPANPNKEADVEYEYAFKAWTPDVSEICYGDATYTATYRRTPIYYTVTWLKDDKTVLSTSNYQYNAKIQQAVINVNGNPFGYGPAEAGKTWAFDHWVQCDKNGNDILVNGEKVIFVRGQKMVAEPLYFYPVFKQVANILEVNFYKEDGTSWLGMAKIPYGEKLSDYDDEFQAKAPKISDDNYHYIIKTWIDVNTGEEVEVAEKNISVKATYTAEAHDKKIFEVVAEPTCNVPGYAHYRCDAAECTAIEYNVPLAPVADEGAPTGHLYVGDSKWTLEDYLNGIDYSEIKYVGPKTTLIVSASDTGTRSMPWNVEGQLNRGVGKIEYNVSLAAIQNPETIRDWTEIYNFEAARQDALNLVLNRNKITLVDYTGFNFGTAEERMKKAEIDREVDALLANNKANATGIVSNLDLEDGKTYVIYLKISDREGTGEVNVSYLTSGTIQYGVQAPVVTVRGEGYGTKFCNDATITVKDDTAGLKAYIDGKEIALAADGTYNYSTMGLHTLEAVDANGNRTTKVFEIKGGHSYRHYVVAESCESNGLRYDICEDCGAKANETAIPALGHKFGANFVDKAPDCVTDGYRTYICENNCGTKLVLNPTDAADKLAQAGLEAGDLDHLKATGAHTYAMVKDENGEDTAEYVWVIDKIANCKSEGSKHRDCTVCGKEDARVTETIEKDLTNGHNFYRVKVTKAPTCTEKGEKTKTCKYCGAVVFVENVDALGHTAGEYRTITAATCETAGEKILKCGECGVDIGEPIKDADGNVTGFDGKSVEIKAIGHAWKLDGEVYQDTDGKWYQNYKCENDETHTNKKVVEGYVPPVAATVVFKNGEETVATINKYVGEAISESAVTAPEKAADATKIYTFSHWADAEGNEVDFPIEVKGNATFTAVFAERYVNYTITYYKEDGTTESKKTGYLHNGEEVKLAAGPSKAETKIDKFVFAGWKVVNSDPEVVYTDKVTIDGANINLMPTYTTVKKQYAVTYAYSSSNQIHTYLVEAGSPAPDVTKDFEITKASDTKYHYTFKEWNRAAQLDRVENNIYTTPNFDAVAHEGNYTVTEKTPATCTTKAVNIYTCTCGYTYEKEEGTVLGHNWGEPVYDETTGKTIIKCQNSGCGITQEDTRTFTVKFFLNEDDDKAIKTVSYISWGSKLNSVQIPADPTKAATNEYVYKFVGWAVKGTTEVVDVKNVVIKADAEYVAIFDKVIKEYTVTFAYDAYNVIKIITGVKAGTDVTYTGATPVKKFDDNYHYTFSGWSGSTTNILKDTYVTAKFTPTAHQNKPSVTSATCTTGEGTVYTCDCGYKSPVVATSKPLGHLYEEVISTKIPPKDGKDGSVTMRCARAGCGHEYVKVLPWTESGTPDTPAVPDTVVIRLTVRDQYGKPIPGATVALYHNANWVAQDITNSDGIVAFTVAPGKYTAVFTGVKYSGDQQTEITVNNDGSVSGHIPAMHINNCGCACHRDNIWGKIFRFFHSIIKMITGEFKCCKDPSDLY